MNHDELRNLILDIFEASLEAQLRAVRRLRQAPEQLPAGRPRKVKSQVDMAYDVLKRARSPLHVAEIVERIQAAFGTAVDRESLVSSLTKKVRRGDRFSRAEKNTFAVLPDSQ
jgi:hypothetical protein